jgi:diaminopimelate decarboxylase
VAGRGDAFQLEIEPGSYLVANAGAILAEIIDVVDTNTPASDAAAGEDGHTFLKVDTGMTELLRPSLYGAQHPIHVVAHGHKAASEQVDYLIAGHCCESGDILTPAPGDSEGLASRSLAKAEIGDTLVIEGTGAYAAGMAAKNYNAFPEAAEVMLEANGELKLIRKRQTLDQILQNEI